jgi:hypothetical protein
MTYARFLTSGTVLATLVYALVLGSEAQTPQWCQGVYDQKGGSNFSSACPPPRLPLRSTGDSEVGRASPWWWPTS